VRKRAPRMSRSACRRGRKSSASAASGQTLQWWMQSGGRPHYPNPYGGGYEGGTSGGGGYNSMGTTAAYYPYGATGGNPHFPYPYDYSSLRDDTIPGGEASQGGTSDRYQEEAADEEGVERQPYSGYSSSEHNAPGAAVGGGPAIMQPQGTYDLTYADLEANEQSGLLRTAVKVVTQKELPARIKTICNVFAIATGATIAPLGLFFPSDLFIGSLNLVLVRVSSAPRSQSLSTHTTGLGRS